MSYSDHKLIRQIVEENHNQEGGFQDLLLALVNSESFSPGSRLFGTAGQAE